MASSDPVPPPPQLLAADWRSWPQATFEQATAAAGLRNVVLWRSGRFFLTPNEFAANSQAAPRATPDQLAAINLYTQQVRKGRRRSLFASQFIFFASKQPHFQPTSNEPCFYRELNAALRVADAALLEKWKPLARLLIEGVLALPTKRVKELRRGVPLDLREQYAAGSRHTHQEFLSTASNGKDDFLINEDFAAAQVRTIIVIEDAVGVDIFAYSAVPSEGEVLLLPGLQVETSSHNLQPPSVGQLQFTFIIHQCAIPSTTYILPPDAGSIDLQKLADGNLTRYGQLGSVVDMIDPSDGASYRQLELHQIYITVDVTRVQNNEAAAAAIPGHVAADAKNKTEVAQQIDKWERAGQYRRHLVTDLIGNRRVHLAVILGAPGSGKSTILRETALTWARDPLVPDADIPILVELKHYAERKHVEGVRSLLEYIAGGGNINTPVDLVALKALLQSPTPVLVMLDGLDEVMDPTLRNVVVEDIKTFVREYPAKTTRVILTSRIVGYDARRFENFEHFVVQPLTLKQAKKFLSKWHDATYGPSEQATREDREQRLLHAIENNKNVRELSENPLLLTMIAIVNRGPILPTRQLELYQECSKLLIARWNWTGKEQLQSNDPRATASLVEFRHKEEILRRLAWRMQQESTTLTTIVNREALIEQIKTVVRVPYEGLAPVVIANGLAQLMEERHGILCFLGGDWYGFMHRTFLEYFCARAVQEMFSSRGLSHGMDLNQLQALFLAHADDSTWTEVLVMISGLIHAPFVAPCLTALIENMENFSSKHREERTWLVLRCYQALDKPEEAPDLIKVARRVSAAVLLQTESLECSADIMNLLSIVWPDEDTRKLLVEVAQLESPVSSNAVGLLSKWPVDEQLFTDLVRIAKAVGLGAEDAVRMLTRNWPAREELLSVLVEVVCRGGHGAIFSISVLVDQWTQDDRVRLALLEVVSTARDVYVTEKAAATLLFKYREHEAVKPKLLEIAITNRAKLEPIAFALITVLRSENCLDSLGPTLAEIVSDSQRISASIVKMVVEYIVSTYQAHDHVFTILCNIINGKSAMMEDILMRLVSLFRGQKRLRTFLLETVKRNTELSGQALDLLLLEPVAKDILGDDLVSIAEECPGGLARRAVAALKDKLEKDDARVFFIKVAKSNSDCALTALEELLSSYPADRSLRGALSSIAWDGGPAAAVAVEQLVAKFRFDDEVSGIFYELAKDGCGAAASRSVEMLALHLPSEGSLHYMLVDIMRNSRDKAAASAAVNALVANYPFEELGGILIDVARTCEPGAAAAAAALKNVGLLMEVGPEVRIDAPTSETDCGHSVDLDVIQSLIDVALAGDDGAEEAVRALLSLGPVDADVREVLITVALGGRAGSAVARRFLETRD